MCPATPLPHAHARTQLLLTRTHVQVRTGWNRTRYYIPSLEWIPTYKARMYLSASLSFSLSLSSSFCLSLPPFSLFGLAIAFFFSLTTRVTLLCLILCPSLSLSLSPLCFLPSQREYLFSDAVAGLTIGIMLIPQGLAYSYLVGVPPLFGTLKHLSHSLSFSLPFSASRALFLPLSLSFPLTSACSFVCRVASLVSALLTSPQVCTPPSFLSSSMHCWAHPNK